MSETAEIAHSPNRPGGSSAVVRAPHGRPLHARQRFLLVARMVARVYAGYKSIQVLGKALGDERVDWMYRRQHRVAAESIYQTATRLEGLLIKACQFLGTRADVLPDEYIEVLSRLQDRVP